MNFPRDYLTLQSVKKIQNTWYVVWGVIVLNHRESNRDFKNKGREDFPGGPVVKNLPANKGDAMQVQSLVQEDHTCHRATKPTATATEARVPTACAPQQEKPLRGEVCTGQLESSPHLPQL